MPHATKYAGGTSRTRPSTGRAFDPADGRSMLDLQSMVYRNSTEPPYHRRSPSAGAGRQPHGTLGTNGVELEITRAGQPVHPVRIRRQLPY